MRTFLEGRHGDLVKDLRRRMVDASENMEFEQAASLRDLITTVEELKERQQMAAAEGHDIDIFGIHAEPPLVAVNVFHVRNGRVVDRRELYWEDAHQFDAGEFLASVVKQSYLDTEYVPSLVHVPGDFEDRAVLEEVLTEKRGRKVEIATPQRGSKKAMLDLVETNARHGFEQRFRISQPSAKVIAEALVESLNLPAAPERIECFDVSHIQGSDTVASMVVWEKGRMKKSDYRKFAIKTVDGIDDFASMREVVGRRYRRLEQEDKPFPGLILIDGGIGQLHAAAAALDELGIINQPVAAIAKREETIFVQGQEDEPIQLDRFLAGPAIGAADTGRSPSLRRQLPPETPRLAPSDFGTPRDPRRGRTHRPQAIAQLRQPEAHSRKQPRRPQRCRHSPAGPAHPPVFLQTPRHASRTHRHVATLYVQYSGTASRVWRLSLPATWRRRDPVKPVCFVPCRHHCRPNLILRAPIPSHLRPAQALTGLAVSLFCQTFEC